MPQTGATRHQKFLKSEKSKTKLKNKKKDLPKGTNVTKTNFKVKKIVIKEQLKKHGKSEALSTKKLNIKELLSRLNHFNTKSRTEALEGFKEIITFHPNVLNENLGQLISGVTPLILNVEKVVRHEALKVLHLILSNTDTIKVEPFFDIMSTYLRSAMTHIDSRIQEDSLLFLDLLLTCSSEKVVEDFHKILPNFLDMISKLRIDSKPGRTLTINLGSQITSVKWRVKVLHRLRDYLNKYKLNYQMYNKDKLTIASKTHIFDESKLNCFPLFNPVFTSVCHMSCFSAKNLQEITPLNEAEKFEEYISTLMPLLFETWLEVQPKGTTELNTETVINEDSAILLKNTLELILILSNLVEYQNKGLKGNVAQLFGQKYKQQFKQHFVDAFPYVTNIRLKQKKTDASPFEDTITDPKLVMENLEICHLFVKFNPNINLKNQSMELTQVLNYLGKTFNLYSTEAVRNTVLEILDTIFSTQNNWTKTTSIMDTIFNQIIREYFKPDITNLCKEQIFRLLCKIALNDWLVKFHSSEAYQEWLKALPYILLEDSITVQTVDILHVFAIRNNESFNKVITPNLLNIIKNMPKLLISDNSSDSQNYYKLYSLMYWIKNWDSESLNLLEKQLINSEYKSDHGKYIFDTLRLRVGGIF